MRIKILQQRLTLCLNPSLEVDRKSMVDDRPLAASFQAGRDGGTLDRGLAVLARAGFCGSMVFPVTMHDATSRCIAEGRRMDLRQTIMHSFHSI